MLASAATDAESQNGRVNVSAAVEVEAEAHAPEPTAAPLQNVAAGLLEHHLHGLRAPVHAYAAFSATLPNLLAMQPTFTFETRLPELQAFIHSPPVGSSCGHNNNNRISGTEKSWQVCFVLLHVRIET